MSTLGLIFHYWMKSKKNFILSILLNIVATIFTILVPVFFGKMMGTVKEAVSTGVVSFDLWKYLVIISVFAFLAFLASRAARIRGAEISSRAMYVLRKDINDAINRQGYSFFDKYETGQIVARATSDVEQTQMIFGFGLNLGLQSTIQIIGIIVSVLSIQLTLSWVFLVAFPTSLLVSLLVMKKLKKILYRSRKDFGALTNIIRENIVGAQVVRIFSMQEKEREKFMKHNKAFFNESIRAVKLNTILLPMNISLIGLMIVYVLYVGGKMVIEGVLPLETIITFQGLIAMSMFPLTIMGQIMYYFVQADAAIMRIKEILEANHEIKEDPNPIVLPELKGKVEFRHVSFGYLRSRLILKDISFVVEPGQTLAILGTTGSGKSTIINLLPRFYDVLDGEILIDDINIKKFKIDWLRRQIGIVSQKPFLFNKSIKENIAFGKEDATLEEIQEAAKIANLHDFIMSLPDQYDTIVGERGTRLSGGQKQRLSIARAIIIKPKILILDDSTSSVDVETEFNIQNALKDVIKNSTTFIITQRISTIRTADKILLLDRGVVVGEGKHEDLIKENELYKQIFKTLEFADMSKKKMEIGKEEGA